MGKVFKEGEAERMGITVVRQNIHFEVEDGSGRTKIHKLHISDQKMLSIKKDNNTSGRPWIHVKHLDTLIAALIKLRDIRQ